MSKRINPRRRRGGGGPPDFTIKLQYSAARQVYRAQVIMPDGSVYATGKEAVDPEEARLLAYVAIRERNWNESPYKRLLDKIEAGTATDKDLLEGLL